MLSFTRVLRDLPAGFLARITSRRIGPWCLVRVQSERASGNRWVIRFGWEKLPRRPYQVYQRMSSLDCLRLALIWLFAKRKQ